MLNEEIPKFSSTSSSIFELSFEGVRLYTIELSRWCPHMPKFHLTACPNQLYWKDSVYVSVENNITNRLQEISANWKKIEAK